MRRGVRRCVDRRALTNATWRELAGWGTAGTAPPFPALHVRPDSPSSVLTTLEHDLFHLLRSEMAISQRPLGKVRSARPTPVVTSDQGRIVECPNYGRLTPVKKFRNQRTKVVRGWPRQLVEGIREFQCAIGDSPPAYIPRPLRGHTVVRPFDASKTTNRIPGQFNTVALYLRTSSPRKRPYIGGEHPGRTQKVAAQQDLIATRGPARDRITVV